MYWPIKHGHDHYILKAKAFKQYLYSRTTFCMFSLCLRPWQCAVIRLNAHYRLYCAISSVKLFLNYQHAQIYNFYIKWSTLARVKNIILYHNNAYNIKTLCIELQEKVLQEVVSSAFREKTVITIAVSILYQSIFSHSQFWIGNLRV